MTVIVRAAADADIEAICVIHNQGIVDRTATLDTALKTPSERRHWFALREARHPVLVAERDGEIAHLVDAARAPGYHKMVLAALACNEVGVALYTSAGFSRVGIYREQGQLDGRWVDVLIMEKIL